MITEQEANNLMSKLVELKSKVKDDPSLINELNKHERSCIENFKYLVLMKTSRYKQFNNYDDLNQEGFEALLKAMKTFNPKKGSFFGWAHNYIGTRISRSANLHTTIRFPLKYTKDITPHKEMMLPLLVEEKKCPDKEFEIKEKFDIVSNAFDHLSDFQKEIIMASYGIGEEKPLSISKMCKKFNLTRVNVLAAIKTSLEILKNNI